MFTIPKMIAAIVTPFSVLFSCRVWVHAQVLLFGALLCQGKRTVTFALRVILEHEPHFINYHRVLSRARVRTMSSAALASSGLP